MMGPHRLMLQACMLAGGLWSPLWSVAAGSEVGEVLWSLRPLPRLDQMSGLDRSSATQPVDQFIQRAFADRQIAPAPRAAAYLGPAGKQLGELRPGDPDLVFRAT